MEFITPLYYFDLKLTYRKGPIVFWNHFNLFNTIILKDLIIGVTKSTPPFDFVLARVE